MNRFWFSVLLLWIVIVVGVEVSQPARELRDPQMVTPDAPDPRVRWLHYPVGGLLLYNPSQGPKDALRLPPGTELWIPLVRPGSREPDRTGV